MLVSPAAKSIMIHLCWLATKTQKTLLLIWPNKLSEKEKRGEVGCGFSHGRDHNEATDSFLATWMSTQWNADSDTCICTDKFFRYDHFVFGHFGDKTLLARIHINPLTLPQKAPKPRKFHDCSVASGGILSLDRVCIPGLPLFNAHPI